MFDPGLKIGETLKTVTLLKNSSVETWEECAVQNDEYPGHSF